MAERIPPLNIEISSTFDKKGFEQAERAVGRLDKTTINNAEAQQKKIKELREAYGLLSKSVSGDNKKVASSLKTARTALDEIEKAEKKIQDARKKAQRSTDDAQAKANTLETARGRLSLFDKATKEAMSGGKNTYSYAWFERDGSIRKRSASGRFKKDEAIMEQRAQKIRAIENAQIKYNQAFDDASVALKSVTDAEKAYSSSIDNAQQSLQAVINTQNKENQILEENEALQLEKQAAKEKQALIKQIEASEKRLLKEQKAQIAQRNAIISKGVSSTLNIVKRAYNKIKQINFGQIIAKFYSFATVFNKLNSFIDASSEWIENLNLLEVVYNDTADAADNVKQRITDLSKQFRMDINALAKYVSVFKQMANAMGQTEQVGTQMADTLSLIAMDIASLRNVSVDQAVSDLTGALAGQVKPVRKYGFDITMYSIEELMREAGFSGNARTMNQSNKQLARAILLIRQSKDAWGDFSKTINTYANQQRVLNDQMTQFKRLLGSVLLGTFKATDSFEEASKTAGPMQQAIWYLNGALIAVNTILEAIVPSVKNFNGAIATGSDEAIDALEEEEEALEGTLASFDKFNALQESKGASDSATAALESLFNQDAAKYMQEFEERLSSINMYAEKIAETILFILYPDFEAWKKENPKGTFIEWSEGIEDFKNSFGGLKETLLSAIKVIAFAANPLLGVFATLGLELVEMGGEDKKEALTEIINLVESLGKAFTNVTSVLVKVFDILGPLILAIVEFVGFCANSPATLFALVAAVMALAAAFALAKAAITAPELNTALLQTAYYVAMGGLIVGTAAAGIGGAIGSAKKHADGGFQTGGFFLAGESGPEWVGRQGNTATILNDNQMGDIMTDSVARGVIKGNIANRQMGGGRTQRSGKIAVVNLNGKHLFDVVEEEGQKEGKVFAKSR